MKGVGKRVGGALKKSAITLVACGLIAGMSLSIFASAPIVYGAVAIAVFYAIYDFLCNFAGAVDGWFRRVPPHETLTTPDRQISKLGEKNSLTNTDYDSLVAYFASGVRAYRSPGCALVLYPGLPGTQGIRNEEMVGFTRSAPLLAAWIRTRGDMIPLDDRTTFDAFNHLVTGLQSGTDPNSPEYWGPATDYSQRIVEAADVALISWMLKDRLQETMSPENKALLVRWLKSVFGCNIYDGNWNLFPIIVGLSLESWGDTSHREQVWKHYSEFKRSYRGAGWFSDGEGGRVDYYNAWQMQYFLYFISQMSPSLDNAFIVDVIRRFAEEFQYFFSPNGFPIFGRSVGYRTALPAPLVLASSLPESTVPPSVARRALDTTWAYFIAKGALKDGTVTQGYTFAQPEIMENYGGRACCLWALRSLIAAYWLPASSPLWTTQAASLPVETESFDRHIKAAGLRVIGDHRTQTVEVRPDGNQNAVPAPLEPMGLIRKIAQIVFRRPFRPDNFEAKYKRPAYRSNRPFCDG